MALESATYINGLVDTNPLGSDPLADADGHLRLIKSTIKATFPNITGPVTANQTELSSPFPPGGIILWSGSIASVPTGWLLCNGTSGTPDLRDRFVVGAGSSYAVGATGGAATVSLSIANLPSHSHGGSTGGANVDHSHTFSGTTSGVGDHAHGFLGITYTSGYVLANTNSDGYIAASQSTAGAGAHSHTYSGTTSGHSTNHSHAISAEGSGTAHENRPPYYALAYIMKI